MMEDKLLTASEVAKIFKVDVTTVRRWIDQGTLEAISLPHVGKRRVYRVLSSTVDEIMKSNTVTTREEVKQ